MRESELWFAVRGEGKCEIGERERGRDKGVLDEKGIEELPGTQATVLTVKMTEAESLFAAGRWNKR